MKMKTPYINNFKMCDDVYNLRRKVIEILYEAKKRKCRLPRVIVRIGTPAKGHENTLGVGGRRHIWITKAAIDKGYNYLLHVTLHELGHAIFNLDHDKECKLMAPTLGKPCEVEEAWDIFSRYAYLDYCKDLKQTIAKRKARLNATA